MKITVKSLISLGIVALAVILPQIAHLAFGGAAGVKYLPMYLPVLLGGCLPGIRWGLAVGIFSPVVSFLITSAFSDPMPALARLPFMAAELAVFASVAGAFSERIAKNGVWAFPAVIAAQVCGRAAFLLLTVIFQGVSPLSPSVIFSQIQTGLTGLYLQAAIVPLIVIALRAVLCGEKDHD